MERISKQNLIPDDIKERYYRKYLLWFEGVVGVLLIVSIVLPYIGIAIASREITKIEQENAEYEYQKQEIATLDEEIGTLNKIINEYEANYFLFSQFLFDLEVFRPITVHIISVDSPDRLINEGAQDDKEKKKPEKVEEKGGGEVVEIEDVASPQIKYEKDLSEQKITIRGYGSSQKDISDYLHKISELSYVAKMDIVAIEEHKIENGVYIIFEATVKGCGYNENEIP